MANRQMNPNARKALDEMKLEIANEFGLANNLTNDNPMNNVFTAGPVGGQMTRKLVEMGEEDLKNKHQD